MIKFFKRKPAPHEVLFSEIEKSNEIIKDMFKRDLMIPHVKVTQRNGFDIYITVTYKPKRKKQSERERAHYESQIRLSESLDRNYSKLVALAGTQNDRGTGGLGYLQRNPQSGLYKDNYLDN